MSLRDYTTLVALPHSVFALPFALAALLFAHRANVLDGLFDHQLLYVLIFVVVAAVSARTAAMSFNRIIDRDIDAANPRTKEREIPAGRVKVKNAALLCALSSVAFLLSAWAIGLHCLVLAPLVLAVLLGYSYTKRFTSMSHLVLGLALALAPGGAWWALRPQVEILPLVIMLAVLLWVAGFDVLYSCQDEAFDKEQGLKSIPARIGVANALRAAFLLHIVSFVLFMSAGALGDLGTEYYWGMALIGALFLGQHRLISADDLSRVNHSFFTFNGVLSLAYFLIVAFAV